MTIIPARDIEALVRTFDGSDWDEMRVLVDGLELYLSKNPADRARLPSTPNSAVSSATDKPPSPSAKSTSKPAAIDVPEGMVVVRAPNLGTFYRAPKPGAPPYVSVGQRVQPETELCLIEVMKLFTSVTSGVQGTVHDILVEDSELVEYDQPLFLIDTKG